MTETEGRLADQVFITILQLFMVGVLLYTFGVALFDQLTAHRALLVIEHTVFVGICTLWARLGERWIASGLFIGMLWFSASYGLLVYGIDLLIIATFLIALLLSALLHSSRVTIGVLTISVLSMGIFFWQYLSGRYPPSTGATVEETFVTGAAMLVLIGGLFLLIGHRTRSAFQDSREQRRRLAAMIEASPDGILTLTEDGRIRSANASALQMFGRPAAALLSQPVETFSVAETSLAADVVKVVRPDGSTCWLEVREASLVEKEGTFTQMVLRDITDWRRAQEEQKALQQRLLQSQRLESVGRLASGVAHDFNNLLTVIQGNAGILLSEGGLTESARQDLLAIRDAGDRANALTRRLLAFSHPSQEEPVTIDMCASLRSLERILRRLVQEDIRLDVQTPSRPCWLVIDRTQFEQIVLNLVVNAVDAMPDGGRIEIVVDAGDAERGLSLAVRDTGEGIPDGIKARLFEPFFTTKPRGIGSGLGLSIVQQIVQSVDGSIAVDSILGEGSVFTVRFASAKPPIAQAEALPLRVVRTVSARILVVEDDAWVRQTLKRMLGQDTHELRFARDAPEADALLRAHDVDLLIADIVLPGESGVSLAQRITARDNAPVVLFLTAHLQEMNISVDLPVPWRLLPKPFSVEALLSTIEKLLSYGVSRNDSARTNDRPASARPSGSDR